ncbi:MAG: hypothetical protein GY801_17485, partial [bacterium]|nr:hypothetical protein [bacterium]
DIFTAIEAENEQSLLSHLTIINDIKDNPGRPFYIIAHHVNNIASISRVIGEGANAIECDIMHDDGKFIVKHPLPDVSTNPVPLPISVELVPYLRSMATIARNNNRLALVIFDCKESNPNLAVPLLETIRNHLTNVVHLNVLISVGSFNDRQFLAPLAARLRTREGDHTLPPEGVAIDYDNDPARVSDFFLRLQIQKHAYGNGITSPLPAPNVPPSIMEAVAHKSLRHGIRFVYVWTVDDRNSMRDYLRMGVDGIMTNNVRELVDIVPEYEFQRVIRIAQRSHDPFALSNIPGYVLEVNTNNRRTAGSDANLRFRLTGSEDTIGTTINAWPPGLFESGDRNNVTLIGRFIGSPQNLTVSRDSAGNAPGWRLNDVVLRSRLLQSSMRFNFNMWIPTRGVTR